MFHGAKSRIDESLSSFNSSHTMESEDICEQHEAFAYIKLLKGMILSELKAVMILANVIDYLIDTFIANANAMYASQNLLTYPLTLDMITRAYKSGYQAVIIRYTDPSRIFKWETMLEGPMSCSLPCAVQTLWDLVQNELGEMDSGKG